MTRKCLFPPQTKEVQLDEKWNFVGKKEESLTEEDHLSNSLMGDRWDHVALDAESRLVISLVPGKRTPDNCKILLKQLKQRTGDRTDILITSDEYKPYAPVIKQIYGMPVILTPRLALEDQQSLT